MAKNQKYSQALHISIPAPYDVESGQPVVKGAIRGIAQVDAKKDEPVTVWLDGAWILNVGAAVKAGDTVGATTATANLTKGGDFGVVMADTAAAGPAEIAPFGYVAPTPASAG